MPHSAPLKALISTIGTLLPRESYLVGGFVRDYLLGRKIDDIDIIVRGDLDSIVPPLAKKLNADLFGFKKENLAIRDRVYTLLVPFEGKRLRIDLSEFKDLKEDLLKRDFTINAMAWKLEDFVQGKEEIIDPYGGIEDLKQKLIRAVRLENLLEDPLRMLRAYRLAHALKFEIDKETREFIKNHTDAIKKVAGERVVAELLKALTYPNADRFFREIYKDNILSTLVGFEIEDIRPTLEELQKFEQLLKEEFIESLAQRLEWKSKTFLGQFNEAPLLRLLVFLKNLPPHKAEKFVKTYPFGGEASEYILKSLEGYRLLRENPPRGVKEIYLYLKRFKRFLLPIGVLAKVSGSWNSFERVLDFYLNRYKPYSKPLLSGKEIIKLGNLKPSPLVGEILEKLILAQLEGKIRNREEAIKFVKNLL